MGKIAPLDNDMLLVLAVAAIIYRENGDKSLLMGLLILLVFMMK